MTQKRSAHRPPTAKSKTGDDFFHRVYEVVARIPAGKVTTYGAIAAYLGLKSSARTVGYAMNGVAGDMDLPCHRVVNRNGELSGKHHFATPTLMRDLLESEDVQFDGEAVVMSEHFWDPAVDGIRPRKPASKRAAGKNSIAEKSPAKKQAAKKITTKTAAAKPAATKSTPRRPAQPKRGKRG